MTPTPTNDDDNGDDDNGKVGGAQRGPWLARGAGEGPSAEGGGGFI